MLDDISAAKVDIFVVYKIDRLTRSLMDFAKIVDVFDGQGVSFVSVTQAFNTTTSMGRLTLNVLLSFAQFEREVTAERIRDKIAASKTRGMWMVGPTPLGYDAREKHLIVNAIEVKQVRRFFDLYLEVGSVSRLKGVRPVNDSIRFAQPVRSRMCRPRPQRSDRYIRPVSRSTNTSLLCGHARSPLPAGI